MLGFSTSLTNVDYYLNLEFTSKSDNNLSIKRVVINTKIVNPESTKSVVMKPISLVVNSWSSVQDVTGSIQSITLFELSFYYISLEYLGYYILIILYESIT
ncbi:hypothetical protein H8356DRAFT_1332788 [Neocallimastix lanati (nom. inval.)]|nr:hypothetical protein H8356DRAFT_1332788 [Neocallimastix sp. JGI-2020a]